MTRVYRYVRASLFYYHVPVRGSDHESLMDTTIIPLPANSGPLNSVALLRVNIAPVTEACPMIALSPSFAKIVRSAGHEVIPLKLNILIDRVPTVPT